MSLLTGAARERLRRAARRGAEAALQALAAEARRRTPVDTGKLRDSCHIEMDGEGGAVVFGAPYAAARHERREGGKFLESACHDPGTRAAMLDAAARAFREKMR